MVEVERLPIEEGCSTDRTLKVLLFGYCSAYLPEFLCFSGLFPPIAFRPVSLEGGIIGGTAFTNESMSFDFEPGKLKHIGPCFLISKDPFVIGSLEVETSPVSIDSPGAVFPWMSPFGIAKLPYEEIVIQIAKDFTRDHRLHIIGFATDNRVHCGYQR